MTTARLDIPGLPKSHPVVHLIVFDLAATIKREPLRLGTFNSADFFAFTFRGRFNPTPDATDFLRHYRFFLVFLAGLGFFGFAGST